MEHSLQSGDPLQCFCDKSARRSTSAIAGVLNVASVIRAPEARGSMVNCTAGKGAVKCGRKKGHFSVKTSESDLLQKRRRMSGAQRRHFAVPRRQVWRLGRRENRVWGFPTPHECPLCPVSLSPVWPHQGASSHFFAASLFFTALGPGGGKQWKCPLVPRNHSRSDG